MIGLLQIAVLSFTGAMLGAVIGNFLNVVIHRTPHLIDTAEGRLTAQSFLAGLSSPPSHCPYCKHRIAWYDNVPILAFFLLQGRCRSCREPYGVRYLFMEALSASVFAVAFAVLGLTLQAFLIALFVAGLIALSVIDIEQQLLPDVILFPLLCLGVTFHFTDGTLEAAALGAATGFGLLWLIRTTCALSTGKEGLGYGDVKLAAVIGAWVGMPAMPAVLTVAFGGGVILMLPLMLAGSLRRDTAIPFGPFLSLGGLCALVLPDLSGQILRLIAPV